MTTGLGNESNGDDPANFILNRELNEVYLLLDHVSADPATNINQLEQRFKRPAGLAEDWLEQVCEIRWPPTDRTPAAQAKDAALLIRAKDYLNMLAKPASGQTIAFTVMVAQPGNPKDNDKTPSRGSLARKAYPDLEERATYFHDIMRRIVWVPIGLLILTCLISWYVAVGNAALADRETAQEALAASGKRVSDAQAALNVAPIGGTAATEVKVQKVATSAGAIYRSNLCRVLAVKKLYPSAELMDGCTEVADARNKLERVRLGLDHWAAPFGADNSSAAWLINLLGGAVLPVLYGFLGAAAAVVRRLSGAIKDSTLSPRALQLSLQQLVLGAVIGACISLFIVAPDVDSGEKATLLGPVALSGSAISFVAGFGVDAVFQAMEALISRIFNITPAGRGAKAEDSTAA
jgi:hypothetical protein